jgi:hypothetical protein
MELRVRFYVCPMRIRVLRAERLRSIENTTVDLPELAPMAASDGDEAD